MTPPVTLVTARAIAADELRPADYRDIYDELRTKMSLRAFVDLLRSQYSIAWWSKYERREIELTRPAMQELRAAVSLPPLPPTMAEVAATIDPDAAVYHVGEQAATRVVMVGGDVSEPLAMRLNEHLEIAPEHASDDPAPECRVTRVTTGAQPRKPTKAIRVRPSTFARLYEARRRSGLTWDAFLSRLIGE